jgi:tetratricopeptide (TPR) repeat protein
MKRWPWITTAIAVVLSTAVYTAAQSDHIPTDPKPSRQTALQRTASALQDRLRGLPTDAPAWAQLGATYTELARTTADPGYYDKAKRALEESLRLRPEGNGEAMLGQGALANARHDFAAAKDWALRAQAVRPDSAEVQGVLVDALTQLGEDATAALQRMLDLRPGVAAFTRASYHYELRGRTAEARAALTRALESAGAPEEIAFCRYYLGELAFNSGRLDDAGEQYERASEPESLHGKAKVSAARGRTAEALADYRKLVARVPLPQYLLEYGELLEADGKQAEAKAQYDVVLRQLRLFGGDDLTAALVAADHGDPAEALRFAQAEWNRRQSVFTADALAWALHVNKRDAEALPYAERAVALGWRNAVFGYHRGTILASLGRAEEARPVLDEAFAINPHFSRLVRR